MGTVGPGSPPHVAGDPFQNLTDTRFRFVPYRGTAPAMQDLLAGQIDLLIDSPITVAAAGRAGKIKAYAVLAKNRYPSAPEIPTMDDAGLPGFHMTVWNALWAEGHAEGHHREAQRRGRRCLADPAVRKRLADLGRTIRRATNRPRSTRRASKAEIEKWWPIIKAANVKGE